MAAAALGRSISLPEKIPSRPLREICSLLSGKKQDELPDEFYDLLERCLDPIPSSRISALEALRHPFFGSNEGSLNQAKCCQQRNETDLLEDIRPVENSKSIDPVR